jgi:hypothetical protein
MPWYIEPLLELLRGLGILKDPEQELKAKELLAQLEAQAEAARAAEFAQFMAATQPHADRVYIWANTLIAFVRPALAVFAVVSPIVWTDRWVALLRQLADAGVWGAVALVPAWAWILGRDGVRMVLALVAGARGVPVPPAAAPPGVPAAPVAVPQGAPAAPPPAGSRKPGYMTPALEQEIERAAERGAAR